MPGLLRNPPLTLAAVAGGAVLCGVAWWQYTSTDGCVEGRAWCVTESTHVVQPMPIARAAPARLPSAGALQSSAPSFVPATGAAVAPEREETAPVDTAADGADGVDAEVDATERDGGDVDPFGGEVGAANPLEDALADETSSDDAEADATGPEGEEPDADSPTAAEDDALSSVDNAAEDATSPAEQPTDSTSSESQLSSATPANNATSSSGQSVTKQVFVSTTSGTATGATIENWVWPWPGTQNHGQAVATVSCDAHDAVRIGQASQLYLLSDPGLRVFCLAPGDYRSAGLIELNNVSGSAGLPRVVQLDSDALASALGVAESADAALATLPPVSMVDSDHWHFIGLRWQGTGTAPLHLERSDAVLVDRARIELGDAGLSVSDSDNWRLQRSLVTADDAAGVQCVSVGLADSAALTIANSEFQGCQRALHLDATEGGVWNAVTVAGNEFHRKPDTGSDCSPMGLWVDGGVDDGSGALTVADNQFSGWMSADACADEAGVAIGLGALSDNTELLRNVIWQSDSGVAVSDNAGVVLLQDTVVVGEGGDGVRVGAGSGDVELINNHFVQTGHWVNSERTALIVSCNAIVNSDYAVSPVDSQTLITANSFFNALPGVLAAQMGQDQLATLATGDFAPLCLASSALSDPETVCLTGAARNPATVDCGSDYWVN